MRNGFVLTGTHESIPVSRTLRAGPLTVQFDRGNLRTIRHRDTEVLRAIGYIVRDRDWGTYEPEIRDLAIEQNENDFRVTYQGTCKGSAEATLTFDVSIEGKPDGSLVFDVAARPDHDFETNRCGFCILHPIASLAGTPVTVEHVDGPIVDTALPDLINPWQPFKEMRAITTPVRPGLTAECRMEGDTFEMEDQRNWSDASYKTYVRPLALPWPYVLKAGETNRQTVSLRFHGVGGEAASAKAKSPIGQQEPIKIRLGAEGPPLPAIGVVVYPDDAVTSLAGIEALRALGPQRLLFYFDPLAGHGLPVLRDFAIVANAYPAETTLEIALPGRRDLDGELSEIANSVATAGLRLDAVMVSPAVDRQSTPPGSEWPDCPPLEDVYDAARRTFPGMKLGGGMLSYFTELNRKRVPAEQLDFISHCTCPIVHAADDLSVMQSLEALPFVTRSVRAIYGDKPYRIGPSTIAMRQNPYGSRTMDNPALRRIAMANRDPRHAALFGAAWALGYAARVAPAGLDQLVLSGLTGPFGLIAEKGEPAAAAGMRPLFHIVRQLSRLAGARFVSVETTSDDMLAGLAAVTDKGLVMLVANLTPTKIVVDCGSLSRIPFAPVQALDAEALVEGAPTEFSLRDLKSAMLELGPYAVASLGPVL